MSKTQPLIVQDRVGLQNSWPGRQKAHSVSFNIQWPFCMLGQFELMKCCLIYLWLLAPLLHHLGILSCKPHNSHWDVCTYICIHVWTRIVTCQRVYQFLTTVCATTSFSHCFQLNCWLYIINPNPSTTTSFSMLPVWTLCCTWKNTLLLEVSTASGA